MADLFHSKLFHSLSSNSSRFPLFSLPFSLSPHSNFSTIRFIPLRRSKLSHSSVLTKLSSEPTQFGIISTTVHSDGSVVFKFGDVSEIGESPEDVNSSDRMADELGTSEDEVGVNDTKSEFLGHRNGDFDVNYVKSEVLEAPGGKYDASDEKSGVERTLDAKHDVNDMEPKVVGTSNGEFDASSEKLEVLGSSFNKNIATEEKSEVVGNSGGEPNASGGILKVLGTSDGEYDANDEKEAVGISDGKNDTSDAKLKVLGTSDGELHTSDEKPEVVGTSDGKHDDHDVKLEGLGTSYGEYNASDEQSVVVGTSDDEHDASDAKLKVLETPIGELDVNDEKPKVLGTSNGKLDGNEAELEVPGTTDGECDGSDEKLVVVMNLDAANDASDAKLEVLGTPIAEHDVNDEKSNVLGTSNSELDGNKAELDVLGTLDVEHDVSDAESMLSGTSDSEHEVKLEGVSVTDVQLPEVEESGCYEVEHSVNGKPESGEAAVESIAETLELVGLRGAAHDTFTNSLADCQHVQYDGDSNVKDVVNGHGDSVEITQQPAPLEVEPILGEEVHSDLEDNSVAVESTSSANMVNDAARCTIVQPDGGDILEVVGPEASGITLTETSIKSEASMEIVIHTLSISSAAASLPHPSEVLTGGEDAYFVCQNWFGIADGVGQWSLGGTDVGQYAQELMQNCEKLASNSQNTGLMDVKEVLQQSAAMTQSTGSARVLIAHFDNQVLHVANIGDSGFVVIRNGAIFKRSSIMVHEFNFPYAISSGDDPLETAEEYHIELEDGDLIITATDGLFDNLYEQEIASIVSKSTGTGMELKDVAKLLVMKAQEVGKSPSARSPFADAAQAAGHTGYIGGKLDHVTVIVSLAQSR